MNIVIAGSQGSGKGTQAELLAKKMGLVHLETGEMFREAAEKNTLLGRKIAAWINKGSLVPDNLVSKLLKHYLTKRNLERGFVLDGSPRGLAQIKWLDKYLADHGSQIDKLIFLKITKQGTIKRLAGRRICPRCDKNYNLVTLPPKKDELCDNCHVKLVSREDDTPQAIIKRLSLYQRRTAPMIGYYKKLGKVIEVDGEKSVKEVFKGVVQALK